MTSSGYGMGWGDANVNVNVDVNVNVNFKHRCPLRCGVGYGGWVMLTVKLTLSICARYIAGLGWRVG